MGSDESHFNVSLIVRDKITRRCPQTTTFEARGKPKQNRADALLLTSLKPYRWAKLAHILESCTILNFSVALRSSKTELALKMRFGGALFAACAVSIRHQLQRVTIRLLGQVNVDWVKLGWGVRLGQCGLS